MLNVDPETFLWIRRMAQRYSITQLEVVRTALEWAKEEGEP